MYVMVILLVANQTQYFALPNPEVPTISDPEKVDFGDKTNNFGTELVMEVGWAANANGGIDKYS